MMQTTGVARFAALKLETRHITLIADAQFAVFKMKKDKKDEKDKKEVYNER